MSHTICLLVDILSKNGNPLGAIAKEFESGLVPIAGMEVEDSVWSNPKKIIRTALDFEEETYAVDLEPEIFSDAAEYEKNKPLYESHDWRIVS